MYTNFSLISVANRLLHHCCEVFGVRPADAHPQIARRAHRLALKQETRLAHDVEEEITHKVGRRLVTSGHIFQTVVEPEVKHVSDTTLRL